MNVLRILSIYLIGLVFGIGIVISGMANPAKVLNFFDFFGIWDPSLIFVMGGAVTVAFVGYRLVLPRPRPLFEGRFQLPTATRLDAKLIGGSALFGIGWGIAGFCPGGALPALGTGRIEVILFTAALLAGIFAARGIQARLRTRTTPTATSGA
ncbi:YeeE/YedE thiosulfate transporter family protein [Roseibacterium beibuensis]|uniref:YeeE/YedE thiosulfate transporter family protein n=1 Tax=[Roseibacterium] beibuensis TaxID=1193142 RepID=A0ABP9LJ50_9RHOB